MLLKFQMSEYEYFNTRANIEKYEHGCFGRLDINCFFKNPVVVTFVNKPEHITCKKNFGCILESAKVGLFTANDQY